MKNKILLILVFFVINCYGAEPFDDNFFKKLKQEDELANIILKSIISNYPTYGESKLSIDINPPVLKNYRIKIRKYYNQLENTKNIDERNVITAKAYNILIIWLIHTINIQNKINFKPNRLFLSLFEAFKNNNYYTCITTHNDLESVFTIMLKALKRRRKMDTIQNDQFSFSRPYLEGDVIIKTCIQECKNHKLPGKYFFDHLLNAVLEHKEISELKKRLEDPNRIWNVTMH